MGATATARSHIIRGEIATASQDHVNKRIHDTVLGLRDEDYPLAMLQRPPQRNSLALKLERRELARRKRMNERQKRKAAGKKKAGPPGAESGDCWVEVWRESNFKGTPVRIHGPAEYATLRFGNEDWSNRIASLRVGPHAFVLAYRDKDFKAEMVSFGPNQEVENLREFKFDNEIDSLKLIDSMKNLRPSAVQLKGSRASRPRVHNRASEAGVSHPYRPVISLCSLLDLTFPRVQPSPRRRNPCSG